MLRRAVCEEAARLPRVAFCDAYPHLQGGAQQVTRLLASRLRDAGGDARIVLPGLGVTGRRSASEGLPTVVVPAGPALSRYGRRTTGRRALAAAAALPGFWLRARRALRGSDVAHVNGHRGMMMFAPAARLAGVPVVWHRHGLPPAAGLDAVCTRLADAVIVPSPGHRDQLGGRRAPPCAVVPSALPHPAVERRRATEPLVVTVARLHPQKGLDVLLAAAGRLLADHPALRVAVVGSTDPARPAYRGRLETQARRRGLGAAVTFHGHRDDPWEVGARAWVYAQPSRTETQGLALWQAMRLGLPVVASDLASIRAAVEDGTTGLLVPPDDAGALADAVGELLADTSRAERLGAAAAERLADHSVARMVAGVTSVYARVAPAWR